MKAEPLYLDLYDYNFKWIGPVQSFVYRCHDTLYTRYKEFEDFRKPGFDELMNKWVNDLFSSLRKVEITYDETLWPPDTIYRSKMKITVDTGKAFEYFIILIDFTKPLSESTVLVTGSGLFSVDLFNVKYLAR